jgi:serum/glucocorticoid-regulated kinase 2
LGIRGKGVAEIKEHPWFGGLDWDYVLSKMYKPPHLPVPKGGDETANFDDFSNLAPLRHAFVLTSEQQSQFTAF